MTNLRLTNRMKRKQATQAAHAPLARSELVLIKAPATTVALPSGIDPRCVYSSGEVRFDRVADGPKKASQLRPLVHTRVLVHLGLPVTHVRSRHNRVEFLVGGRYVAAPEQYQPLGGVE